MRYKSVIPSTIRWRLPLSYAVIALIAALALGLVLMTTLHDYYARGERQYLRNNVRVVDTLITYLSDQNTPPEALEEQLQNIAFLTQVRIQLLDDSRAIISDTGIPENNLVSIAPGRGLRVITASLEPPDTSLGVQKTEHSIWAFAPNINTGPPLPLQAQTGNFSVEIIQPDQPFTDPALAANLVVQQATPEDMALYIPARRSLFGFDLNERGNRNLQRSQEVFEMTLPANNQIASYIQLSQGPAYGTEILNSVIQGWAIASAAAVLFAAFIGLIISRQISGPLLTLTHVTTQMADGELTARAPIKSRDEVGTLARSFNKMADQVEETIVTLRRFVADAAHELHTPLTALRTNIELAAGEHDHDQHQVFVERALSQVRRLEILTTDLLELSRLEAGKTTEDTASVNLNQLIEETSEIYASQAEQSGIDYHMELPEQAIIVRINERQIRRALGNLLENAIKFTSSGGAIHIGLHRCSDSAIELWVQDTGIGIPEDDIPHLFSRFHRGHNAYTYAGSGLGLAIVKAISDSHAGQVIAHNTASGARLTLRLPT